MKANKSPYLIPYRQQTWHEASDPLLNDINPWKAVGALYIKSKTLYSRLHDRGLVGLNIVYMVSGHDWIVEIRVL